MKSKCHLCIHIYIYYYHYIKYILYDINIYIYLFIYSFYYYHYYYYDYCYILLKYIYIVIYIYIYITYSCIYYGNYIGEMMMTHWDFKAHFFLRPWQNALKFAAASPRLTTRGIHDVSSENKRNHSCNPRELHEHVVKTQDSQSMIFPRVVQHVVTIS